MNTLQTKKQKGTGAKSANAVLPDCLTEKTMSTNCGTSVTCAGCISYFSETKARGECVTIGQIVNGRSANRKCWRPKGDQENGSQES